MSRLVEIGSVLLLKVNNDDENDDTDDDSNRQQNDIGQKSSLEPSAPVS